MNKCFSFLGHVSVGMPILPFHASRIAVCCFRSHLRPHCLHRLEWFVKVSMRTRVMRVALFPVTCVAFVCSSTRLAWILLAWPRNQPLPLRLQRTEDIASRSHRCGCSAQSSVWRIAVFVIARGWSTSRLWPLPFPSQCSCQPQSTTLACDSRPSAGSLCSCVCCSIGLHSLGLSRPPRPAEYVVCVRVRVCESVRVVRALRSATTEVTEVTAVQPTGKQSLHSQEALQP